MSGIFSTIIYIGLVLLYMLNDSLMGMIVLIAAMGFMDGVGYYISTKDFREMKALAHIPESDRMVGLDLVQRIGGTSAPTLLSVFGNGVTLPVMLLMAPLAYLAKVRLGGHASKA